MTRVYLALGSNLAEPHRQVRQAIHALAALPQCRLLAASSLYRTRPLGPQDQPDYVNAAVALETALSPKLCWTVHSALSICRGGSARPSAGGRVRWMWISCCLVSRLSTARA